MPTQTERNEAAQRSAEREQRLKDLEWAFVVAKADTKQAEGMRDDQLHINRHLTEVAKSRLLPDDRQGDFGL